MRVVAWILALSLLVPLASLSAQVQPEPGTRVRVTGECAEQYTATSTKPQRVCSENIGTFERVADGSIMLAVDESGTRLTVPFDSVTRFDMYRRRRAFGVGKGMLYGLLIFGGGGALAGALIGSSEDAECGIGDHVDGPCPLVLAAVGAVVFGVPSTIIGGVAGALIKTDRWEEVPLDQLRVSLTPQRDGRLSVGFSIAF